MFKARKRKLSQPGPAAVQGHTTLAQLRSAGALHGGAPPLRGSTSGRAQALATFHGLVASGSASSPAPLGHSGPIHAKSANAAASGPRPGPGPSPAHPVPGPITAFPGAPAPLTHSKLDAAAAAYAGAVQPPPPPSAAPDTARPAAPATAPPSPLAASRAAQRLPRAISALRGYAERLAQPAGSYLYQQHEQLTAARQQLDACLACLACLPALLAARSGGNAGGVEGGRGDVGVCSGGALSELLLEGSSVCWVSGCEAPGCMLMLHGRAWSASWAKACIFFMPGTHTKLHAQLHCLHACHMRFRRSTMLTTAFTRPRRCAALSCHNTATRRLRPARRCLTMMPPGAGHGACCTQSTSHRPALHASQRVNAMRGCMHQLLGVVLACTHAMLPTLCTRPSPLPVGACGRPRARAATARRTWRTGTPTRSSPC